MRIRSALLLPLAALLGATSLSAQFQAGDVYREVVWRPSGTWERVTGDDATLQGARANLPNPVHFVSLPDLSGATRCEVRIEKLSSHSGTRLPRMRVNSNPWIAIPEAANAVIPGTRGRAGDSWEYLQMAYPVIPVPLAQLRTGSNSFEFACQGTGGVGLGAVWPQWLHYGVTFRIYYPSATAGAPQGAITSPDSGDLVGDDPKFVVQASPAQGSGIARVELFGDYDDFDWNGDGQDAGWRGNFRYGLPENHIGTATNAPFEVTWQNAWVPTQQKPFRVIARIVSDNGLIRVSQPITIGMLRDKTVVRYQASNVSYHWQTNGQRPLHSNNCYVTGDLSKAVAAQFVVATWNATALDQLKLNGQFLRGAFGRAYDTSYDSLPIPVASVQPANIFETIATTPEHGIEVQWPGFEIFVRYDIPETASQFLAYGVACTGTNGAPMLSNQGLPALGGSYTAKLASAKANTAAIILNGFSKDKWSGFDLPFDWTPLGAPGCILQTSVEFTLNAVTDANGEASQLFLVPNRTEFLGGSLFAQFAVFDPSANALGLTFSNAGRWVFGN